MPTAIALRSFDHNGKVTKGQEVTFDRVTMEALRRSRLVGPDIDDAKVDAPEVPAPAKGAAKPTPTKGKLPGKKSAVSPAAPALPVETLPPSLPGALPPPLPEK